jgi:hypothetical protein
MDVWGEVVANRLFATAVVCALLAACDANAPMMPFNEGIQLADSPSALDRETSETPRFDFGTLRELWIRVRVADMGQLSMLNVKLVSPRGVIHYETNAAFSPDPAMKTTEMTGAHHPVTVFHAPGRLGGFDLDVSVPVQGTVLTRHLKTGAWQVMAGIEGSPKTYLSPMDVYVAK